MNWFSVKKNQVFIVEMSGQLAPESSMTYLMKSQKVHQLFNYRPLCKNNNVLTLWRMTGFGYQKYHPSVQIVLPFSPLGEFWYPISIPSVLKKKFLKTTHFYGICEWNFDEIFRESNVMLILRKNCDLVSHHYHTVWKLCTYVRTYSVLSLVVSWTTNKISGNFRSELHMRLLEDQF